MARRRWPLRSAGWAVASAVLCAPSAREHPAPMGHQRTGSSGRHPCRGTRQHLAQAFPAARCVIGEIRAPGIHLGLANGGPRAPVPVPEVSLAQLAHHHMAPAPASQQAPDIAASTQIRGADHLGQVVAGRLSADASRQSAGLAGVQGQIGVPDAAAFGTSGPGMAPSPPARIRERVHQRTHATGCTTASQANRLSTSVTCWAAPSVSPV